MAAYEYDGRRRRGIVRLPVIGNEFLARYLMFLVVLSPIPFGSNRPFIWTVSGLFVAFGALVYVISGGSRRGVHASIRSMPTEVGLFVLLIAYLGFQFAPSHLVPDLAPLVNADGIVLAAPHITVAPGATLLMLIRMLTYGLFFFLMVQVAINPERRQRMLELVVLAIVLYAAYAIAALHFGDRILLFRKWAYLGSATGTFVNRNSFATFLAFGAIVSCVLMLEYFAADRHEHGPRRIRRYARAAAYAIALLIILATVVSTRSRMGLVVTAVGLCVAALLAMMRSRNGLRIMLIAVPVMLVAVFGILALYGEGLLERFQILEQSADIRTNLYSQILELIADRPLTGYGGGAFQLVYPLVHRPPVGVDVVWDKAHSTYLALWLELGLVAGTIPMLLLAVIGLRLAIGVIAGGAHWRAPTIGLAVLLAGALHSTVDFSLEIQAVTFMYLTLIAMGLAAVLGDRALVRKGEG